MYASINGAAANVTVRLAGGVLGSVEAAPTLPLGTPLDDRHELIARRGVASDRTVDTQVAQSSVSVTTDDDVDRYTDTDDEFADCNRGNANTTSSVSTTTRGTS